MRKFIKTAVLSLGLLVLVMIGLLFGVHQYRLHQLSTYVVAVDAVADPKRFAVRLSEYVSREHRGAPAPFEIWYGAASSSRLPEWLRLPTGFLETLMLAANCDSQARAAVYLLNHFGIKAHQFDVFGGGLAHSFARAKVAGKWIILDPYTGVVPTTLDDKLVGFEEMQERGLDGLKTIALRPDGPAFFVDTWDRFSKAVGAPSREPVWMPVDVDLAKASEMIGTVDGDSTDIFRTDGIDGIASRFFGAEFGSGKNSAWRFHQGTPHDRLRIQYDFVDGLPPSFPVEGASCDWGDGSSGLVCAITLDENGAASVRYNYGSLHRVYRIDRIRITVTGE